MLALAGGCVAAAAFAQTGSDPFQLSGRAEQGGLLLGTAPEGTVRLTLDGKPVPLAPGGRFLIGFDRDQGTSTVLQAERASGAPLRQTIAVSPRSWRIENINVARTPGGVPSEAYRIHRAGELKRIEAARAVNSSSEGWRQRFVWPATGRISGLFGSQRVYRGEPAAYHSGVDVAPGSGAPVVAPADGVVVLAGPPAFSLEGNLVIIDHGMGLNSAFLHLATNTVREGQAVRQGQLIGTVGATGRATGPHLHWSMKWIDARLDPQALAGPMTPVR
ncbi:Murein DD-endopeptidase MepM and murein hydrolase activator NlpD, contain LysM domain [Allosphingosinicella indica]|uniref:Murein DD-endopeptidase MepM and murein hydrolase activator NlpD, contain LysM domain n=1 Tax=Allosphingosinicella indica TaxID=941907 RepID=A0A1X7GAI8_9SPHN|nr:Murein DD-endopeptidase MepM and murein hydrolase activator NlpD, contain LysM domain [Allosphingosinicella indica]